ncbi:hypothetical protein QBC46DRAFT_462872 [Diplogelasinospora grovesii]|uniref:Nephrocystin 3-like N-terminal domain-containing protein n=1 Tax=Diplogelasinospora grovesii TaxID=303347 RepID=A0AAN6MVQ4_9PEZI|nr:hypothetical protein QBC46DRAFT_462872 [Diplogelasinospora grovesii]
MAEALGLVASIVAVVDLAGKIAGACKFYIETVKDYPRDLRIIYVEIGSLKSIFEGLSFLDKEDAAEWKTLKALRDDGLVKRCENAMEELGKLFPPFDPAPRSTSKRPTKEKMQRLLDSLSWPSKIDKAKRLLDEIMRYKSTMGMALQGQILPSVLHNAARDLYENGTGDWRALWLHGIPGAGKTVLASHVIEGTLQDCKVRNEQDSGRKRTTCLLADLDEIPVSAWEAYERRTEPNLQQLQDVLSEVVRDFDRVYIGIDALDESQDRRNLLALIETLIIETRFSKIQLFAASREYGDISRKMGSLSQPLSMSNSFVEADIRLYVAAKIKQNAEFRRFPPDLRDEVENKLSAGAKGMFRWVVCQLDILRRLHHQSRIRQQLESLPETLDETYDRIFSFIADEHRELVRHTLQWICFHDFLWKNDALLPAQVLLDSYAMINEAGSQADVSDFLLDLETLKDACGCLVSFSNDENDAKETAKVAHYTVREFLESTRMSTSLNWIKIPNLKDCYGATLTSMFEHGLRSHAPVWRRRVASAKACASDQNCDSTAWPLVQPHLAFRLLDPSSSHSRGFDEDLDGDMSLDRNCSGFWSIFWTNGSQFPLLLMSCFDLAKVFIQNLDRETLMEDFFSLRGRLFDLAYPWVDVKGNIMQLLVSMGELNNHTLQFLHREFKTATKSMYHDLLPTYMTWHIFCTDVEHHDTCCLRELLRNGADPNPAGSQITPLQFATHCRDVLGVTELLKAGANPNDAGCSPRLSEYHITQGLLPMEIIDMQSDIEFGRVAENDRRAKIKQLLLEYGASPVDEPRQRLDDDEENKAGEGFDGENCVYWYREDGEGGVDSEDEDGEDGEGEGEGEDENENSDCPGNGECSLGG